MTAKDFSLTNKQRVFAEEYVKNGLNGTQAYKLVYDVKSDKSAESGASRTLRNDKVSAYVAHLCSKATKRFEWCMKDIIENLAKTALSDKQEMKSWNSEKEVIFRKSDAIKSSELLMKYKGIADGGGKDKESGDGSEDVQSDGESFSDRVLGSVKGMRES